MMMMVYERKMMKGVVVILLFSGGMDDACSGQTELTQSTGTIKSPGYDASIYPNEARCQWLISASPGKVGKIR